ncbi:MAG: xanthine dehydrogenase family protein subunit M, partial [Clostridia bacterium]|nr:xanthine dehydrogenase family protein subunit M [Clostridia bacterium]
MLPRFELLVPQSLEEAVQLLSQPGDKGRILAGGTD